MVDVQAYLDRIGFKGAARPDLATLRALHRAHLLAIPYENLDVQLGRPLTPDPLAAFEKIVGRRRGGWCYEMNGVFALALEAIGFEVMRMAGGVARQDRGEDAVGNHLVLRVDLDEPWIADVGFGDGALEPYPLREAAFSIDGYQFRLEAVDPRWWRFHNHEFGGAPTFDFAVEPAAPALLADRCAWLQTSPDSPFVQNAVVQRFTPDSILQLRGRVLRRVGPAAKNKHLIGSADEFVDTLAREFALDLPDAADLWPKICARHDQFLAAPSA